MAPIFIAHVIGVISCAYIESGIYIFEQQRDSFTTGATLRLQALIAIFWLGVSLSRFELPRVNMPATSKAINNMLFGFVSVLLLIYLANVVFSWPPPLLGEGYVSRFDYFETTELWRVIEILGPTGLIIPIVLGMLACVNSNKNKIIAIGSFVVYLVYMLLVGNKFGGIIYPLFLFFIPVITNRLVNRESILSRKGMLLVFMGFLAVFSLIYYHYSTYILAEEFGGSLNFIFYRIFGLQSHLWWGIDEYLFVKDGSPAEWGSILESMQSMMIQVAPTDIANSAIARGVQFAFGFPASAVYYFGAIGGALVCLVTGFFVSMSARFVTVSVSSRNVVVYVFATFIYLQIIVFVMQGSYGNVFSYRFLGLSIIMLLSIFVSTLMSGRREAYDRNF